MNFNNWQIDKLRRGLQSYRLLKGTNGKLVPWCDVVDAILFSDATRMQHPASGEQADMPLKEEALRRFANGQSTLEPGKLADVMRFLISVRVLTEEEMRDGGQLIADAVAVRTVLANTTPAGVRRLTLFAPHYRSRGTGRGAAHEEIELRVVDRADDGLIYVEEQRRHIPAGDRHLQPKDRVSASFVRKGFAIAMTERAALNIFLHGPTREDLVHYVEISSRALKMPERDNAVFLCIGPEVNTQNVVLGDPLSEAMQSLKAIHFVATDAQPPSLEVVRAMAQSRGKALQ